MTNPTEENFQVQDEKMDQAVARRLGRLRAMPVELAGLERRIKSAIPRDSQQPLRIMQLIWNYRMRAVAAGLIFAAILVTVFYTTSGTPVMASAQEMAQFHDDLVSGRVTAQQVTSIAAANQALASQYSSAPQLPEVPQEHVMACCMKSVKGKHVACVLLEKDGTPVTMTVANAAEMSMPPCPMVTRNGSTYRVQAINDLNMVMTERDGKWVCLIGKLSSDRLMDIADQLRF
jgi:hypothetical protein